MLIQCAAHAVCPCRNQGQQVEHTDAERVVSQRLKTCCCCAQVLPDHPGAEGGAEAAHQSAALQALLPARPQGLRVQGLSRRVHAVPLGALHVFRRGSECGIERPHAIRLLCGVCYACLMEALSMQASLSSIECQAYCSRGWNCSSVPGIGRNCCGCHEAALNRSML